MQELCQPGTMDAFSRGACTRPAALAWTRPVGHTKKGPAWTRPPSF